LVLSTCSLHPLLFDAAWWRERIGAMGRVPRHLLVFPRSELSLPGTEVAELWLRAHDGVRLRGLLARSLLAQARAELHLAIGLGEHQELDWEGIARGRPELHFEPVPARRLEDRVLDLIRVAQAARSLAGMGESPTRLVPPLDLPLPDEVQIAERLLGEGWV
jgi:hypothetical protein